MAQELPKSYDPKTTEKKWYTFWEQNKFFSASAESKKPAYCIVIPPPNVTGTLHMGHALDNTLIDILIRWKRMSGFEALWVPGTDHAGIATQTVVERNLMKETGKKRKEFSRDEFLKHVWEWKEKSQHTILSQLKSIGASCDWSRQRFTMDEGNNRAVRKMFKKMFDEGVIYQGDYLVNWDPVTQTALADDEVEYEERQSFLWHFKYPFKDGSGYAIIATTRPETMLGDTAVAVSTQDQRYAALVGKTILLPLMNREIPLIADHRIEAEFGTGMVKVTPAHDHTDYAIGQAHNLPLINIMTPDGKINENGGVYAGLTMAEAREKVVADMDKLGLLYKKEPHVNRVGVSYRSKAVIEPFMSKQWFIKMDGFAKKMKALVEHNKVKLLPKNWEAVYFHWINNLRDWCISRQLWWGHRIPIWTNKQNPEKMICYDGEGVPPEVQKNPEDWEQDEDVLDTWFSSSLWPFATLGWPEITPDLKKFYPNSTLITGYDILFFWVARMLMMGEYALGQPPYPETFLHGLIFGKSYWRNHPGGGLAYCTEKEREEFDMGKPIPSDVQFRWEKMSKSKGNVIDPVEIIDQFGADAMRMGLCASSPQAREIDLDRRRFEEFKNFANKVWNGARFVLMNLEGENELKSDVFSEGLNEQALTLEDHWILSVLNRVIQDVNKHLANYTFDQAANEAYEFFWNQFCAYYVEISKPILFGKAGTSEQRRNKQKLLVILLCQSMRLLHPMTPFITEELFQILKERMSGVSLNPKADVYTQEAIEALLQPACIVAPYPKVLRESDINEQIEQDFRLMEQIVYAVRNIRGEMKLPPGTSTEVHIIAKENDPSFARVQANQAIISALVKTHRIQFHHTEPKLGFASAGFIDALKVVIPLPAEMVAQEKVRLEKELDKLSKSAEKLKTQLSNIEFTAKAPPQLIEKQNATLKQTEHEIAHVQEKLSQL